MQGTLVLTILTVQSSYLREVEQPLAGSGDAPDTIQWWIAPSGAWRIRTYGIDHDIHTHSVGSAEDLVGLAVANAQKHYGDVIQSQHVIELSDALDAVSTDAALRAAGLEARLEIATERFAFWKPDDERYRTQSQPR